MGEIGAACEGSMPTHSANPILDHLPTQKNCSHCNFTFAERLTFKSKFGQGI